jgi:predicted MFS family arabinose efflux permease
VYVLADWVAMQASSFTGFLVAALLAGIGHGYCFPVLVSQVVTRTSAGVRGSALAAFTALWAVSELWVTPALGVVADAHGDGAMFGLTGVVAIGFLAVWLGLEHRYGRAPDSPHEGGSVAPSPPLDG